MSSSSLAIVQGRMHSSRLPGKILLDLAGRPMLERVVERARRAHGLDQVMVATTRDPSDDPVEAFCRDKRIPVFRGDMFDVLDRFYQAACEQEARIIVRITADCPLVDPILIEQTLALITGPGLPGLEDIDFACSRLPPPWSRTFPIGLDVEVCTFTALEHAWREADQKFQREHVMPFLYEGVELTSPPIPLGDGHTFVQTGRSARGFQIAQLQHEPAYGNLRWTVDTPEDLELMRGVLAHLHRDDFTWQEVLALQQREPELFAINARVAHKTVFDVDEREAKD